MINLLLHISVICISLIAWLVLTVGTCFLYRRFRQKRRSNLLFMIAVSLWLVTSFNVFYEGFFLIQKMALLSSVNSWFFTLIIPQFYLYYRMRITGQPPVTGQWIRHLVAPALLAVFYVAASFSLFSPDRFIYNWQEAYRYRDTWWMFFRISCYVVTIMQLCCYLPFLFGSRGIKNTDTPQAWLIRRQMLLTLGFYIVSIFTVLTPYLFFRFLYSLAIIGMGVYVFWRSPYFYRLKSKFYFYILPVKAVASGIAPQKSKSVRQTASSYLFSPEKETCLRELLSSPEWLYNPELNISTVASQLSTNESYLSRYFNQQLGVSFPEYITNLRLDAAEKLLQETSMNVTDIITFVGFQTSSSFYLSFNIRHKMPPAQWRKEVTK